MPWLGPGALPGPPRAAMPLECGPLPPDLALLTPLVCSHGGGGGAGTLCAACASSYCFCVRNYGGYHLWVGSGAQPGPHRPVGLPKGGSDPLEYVPAEGLVGIGVGVYVPNRGLALQHASKSASCIVILAN